MQAEKESDEKDKQKAQDLQSILTENGRSTGRACKGGIMSTCLLVVQTDRQHMRKKGELAKRSRQS